MTNVLRTARTRTSASTNQSQTTLTEKWVRASSSLQTKTFIRNRIDHFLSNDGNSDLYKTELQRWNEIKTSFGRTSLHVIAEFGLNTLKLTSFRKTKNWKNGANQDKVEFLEPWPPREASSAPTEESSTPTEPVSNTVTNLSKVCTELYGSEPAYDTRTTPDTSGKLVYETTVRHANNPKLVGTAMALTGQQARNDATTAALLAVQQGISSVQPASPDTGPPPMDIVAPSQDDENDAADAQNPKKPPAIDTNAIVKN